MFYGTTELQSHWFINLLHIKLAVLKDVKMKKVIFLTIGILVLSLNAYSADVLIGHAYYFKCPYLNCNDEAIYARPLFKKTQNGWQVFPNGKDIGYNPDAVKQSYKLFPSEIKWNIFNIDQSLIGKKTVENKKPVEWLINTGAAQMQIDPKIIKQNIDSEADYDLSADLILSTNENVTFSKFKTRETADVEIFESAIKKVKDIGNITNTNGTIEKSATIYSIGNVDVIAILDIEQIYDQYIETNSVVLSKTGDKWDFAFDASSLNFDEDDVLFSLKTIADFDNDGKSEYIFNLLSGVHGYGYILWQAEIAKPLVYRYYAH